MMSSALIPPSRSSSARTTAPTGCRWHSRHTVQRGDVPYEIVVVDNNSTDVPRPWCGRSLRWITGCAMSFEPKQGLSHGRNTGIASPRRRSSRSVTTTSGSPDWIVELKRAFDEHPEIDYVGGRVLPQWLEPPPPWLTSSHWSPLAVQDYGDEPRVSGPDHAVCLVGASLAFRRTVFDSVGLFTPALGRIKDGIGSTEDHEMQLRMWRLGMRGLYHPRWSPSPTSPRTASRKATIVAGILVMDGTAR